MGDAINMARFFPAVADRVREKLWIYAHPATGVLFRNSIPESMVEKTEIVLGPMPLPAQVDAFIPTMSIPVALKVTAEQVRSHPEPYLFARQPLTLPADGQADVGIVWAGGTAHDADRYRSAKLADFLPLGEVPGVRLHSLQVGDRSRDLILQRGHGMVRDWSSEIATLHDTANIIAGLDLVITVDTAVAHLAGAMGHPVWTLVSQQALDYRWLRKGDRTIWYPSMRLFRQPLRTSWSDLILNEVKPALMELVGARE